MRAVLKPALEILAGIPTVVFGYFALTFVTPLLQDIGLERRLFNALSAGLVDGRDAHPDGRVALRGCDGRRAARASATAPTRSASTRLQVSTRIVVPAAISGIIASFRARDLARDRRDDDRADRRPAASPT